MYRHILGKTIFTTALLCGSIAAGDENVMVVFDGSNSMWGQIEGTAKIEIAREVMDNLLGDWSTERNVGLMAYGHRRQGDCTDIELLVEPGAQSRQVILDQINQITPRGKTPLTDAVEAAAKALAYTDQPATVVLISDGVESCERDPCAVAAALAQGGVGFTAHVVGFGLGADEDTRSLACIAESTGGQYISASNAQELGAALSTLGSAVAQPAPEPEPEPAPEPETPQVVVKGPDTAVGGAQITVTWDPTVGEKDYITIVPVGSEPDRFGVYQQIGTSKDVDLLTPGGEGLYEIRYLSNPGKEVLGLATLEVSKPQVDLTAAESAQTGEMFDLSWSPTIYSGDYVTIVPMGADEGTFGDYRSTGDQTQTTLTAPAEPGLYEIRYLLNVDKRTVATREIEVTAPQVTLQAPQTAVTGAAVKVSWGGTVNERDYITIVPAGTEEGRVLNYITVRDLSEGEVIAPAEPGLYELRYVLREGGKTMASAAIELTAPSITVSGPETVLSGAAFDVSWTGTVSPRDYVSIVPAGAEEGTILNYLSVQDKAQGVLNAPSDPGLYEIRYILREGAKTMASAMIEVTQPEMTLSAPETAIIGQKIKVSWSSVINPRDYVTIVPMGSDEGTISNYLSVHEDTQGDLQAPADTGLYEIRYLLREGSKTIASAMIELTEPEVSISAPEAVRAGDPLPVSWTGTVDARDYIVLVPMGTPDGEFGIYGQVRALSELDLKTPEETGLYEIRYQLREGSRVLARQSVEILAADAPLESGASLTAPESAAPGSAISVGWSVDSQSADQRITLAQSNQPIFTWIAAQKITSAPPVEITLPETPGVYELRLLDLTNKEVLSRKIITVE
ncbi:MAG: VWA domain-containing protein [Mangrovicoccus sp.]|nr:VWA domain-containing protein [Mangrovicoccus sp.]